MAPMMGFVAGLVVFCALVKFDDFKLAVEYMKRISLRCRENRIFTRVHNGMYKQFIKVFDNDQICSLKNEFRDAKKQSCQLSNLSILFTEGGSQYVFTQHTWRFEFCHRGALSHSDLTIKEHILDNRRWALVAQEFLAWNMISGWSNMPKASKGQI